GSCALLTPILFFFSSRRRHTSFSRDWSSDVCSSDLGIRIAEIGLVARLHRRFAGAVARLLTSTVLLTIFLLATFLVAGAALAAEDRKSVVEGKRVAAVGALVSRRRKLSPEQRTGIGQ